MSAVTSTSSFSSSPTLNSTSNNTGSNGLPDGKPIGTSSVSNSIHNTNGTSTSTLTSTSTSTAPPPFTPPLSHQPQDLAEACIARLRTGTLLAVHDIRLICAKVTEILCRESNVHALSTPITLVGDVHGQFYDVLELFRIGGDCPSTNYLFLGDYVDRGHFSVETISLLVCLKLRYPERIVLLRGNHECRAISRSYGFYAECMTKYGDAAVWSLFTDLFDYMPLAALIDTNIFCCHGGVSPSFHSIDQIRCLDRFVEIPFEGPMCDLIWGDPDADIVGFQISTRGAGYTFGKDVVDKFMQVNDINYFVRAHQLCQDGYQILWDKFVTVWSAPNYCDRMGNLASILEISEHQVKHFNVYSEAPATERKMPIGGMPPRIRKKKSSKKKKTIKR